MMNEPMTVDDLIRILKQIQDDGKGSYDVWGEEYSIDSLEQINDGHKVVYFTGHP